MKEKGRKVKGRTWLPIQLLATPCCECPATPSCYARSPGYSPVHRAFFVWLRNGCREEVIEKWLLNFFIKCSQQLPLHLLCLLENDVEDAHLPLTTSAGVQYFQHNANTVLQQNTRTSDVFTNWLTINIPTSWNEGQILIFSANCWPPRPNLEARPDWKECVVKTRETSWSHSSDLVLWGFYGSFLLDRSETGRAVSAESVKTAPNIITSEQQSKENLSCTVWGTILC